MQSDSSTLLLAAIALFAIYLISKWFNATTHQLKHIPTVGSSGVISSYWNAFQFFLHGHEIIHEGYKKYYGSAFKVSTISEWLVIASGPQMIDDIRRAGEEYLSFDAAIAQTLQTDYTIGREVRVDPYHIPVIRTPLTRSLAIRFADIKDEITTAFGDLIPVNEHEWTTVPALKTVLKIVCRTSNRLFVGLPLCRDPDYRELNEQFTINVFVGAQLINMFPSMLKPIVGQLLTKVPANIKRAVFHVRPLIEAQLEQERQFGKDWPDKPNNLISWLLDSAQGSQRNIDQLALRVLAVNLGAIHTTSNAFTNVLYNLAAHPEYVAPLREEVEAVIEADGWTKASMEKMRKVDSFIKESERLAMGGLSLIRKVMKDFTFSNGITLPAGTALAVAGYSTHMDEQNYNDPSKFQGFRFAEMRDDEGEGIKHQMVSLAPDYLSFGVGRHACPGRFFATNELKAMLAHVVLHYDVKFPNDGPRPQAFWFQGVPSPNRTAEVMFRKRA